MEIRIKKEKYKVYGMDIESHNDIESKIRKKTSMWLGSFQDENSDINDKESYFYSIEEWLEKLKTLANAKRGSNHNESRPVKNVLVYIFNLAFEWSFILPVLLKLGFKFSEHCGKEEENVYNSVTTHSCSSVWNVNLRFNKGSGNVIIRDLSKLYPGSLRVVAQSFGLETQKGDIDYELNRNRPVEDRYKFEQYIKSLPQQEQDKIIANKGEDTWRTICEKIGLSTDSDYIYPPTKEEKIYCYKDVRIIIEILMITYGRNDKDFFQSFSSASYAMRKLLRTAYPNSFRPMKDFRKNYPHLGEEETNDLKKTIGGGITYAPELFQFKDIKQKILHIDKHNMHPSSCYFNIFPYGYGEKFTGRPTKFGMFINAVHIKISYAGVKLHSIIQLIGINMIDDYDLWVWDFEIPTMMKCYMNLKIEYIGGYCYKAKPLPWRKFYSFNYTERLKAKKIKDLFLIAYYKLLNNASYGKFLEHAHINILENIIGFDGIITSKEHEKDISNYSEQKYIEKVINAKYTYLPVGSCIPAYSRVDLIETALKFGWEKICYFDTDSIFVLYDEETEKVWKTLPQEDFLGNWGLEEIIEHAQFTAPKRYKYEVDGNFFVKMAGVNFKDTKDFSFDEVNIVSNIYEVKRAYRVRGGTIIDVQVKSIKIQDKYKYIAKKNLYM